MEIFSQVIYGDTDSVMVKFGTETVPDSMELGKEAAAYVSEYFTKPIKLEFEKVRRYAVNNFFSSWMEFQLGWIIQSRKCQHGRTLKHFKIALKVGILWCKFQQLIISVQIELYLVLIVFVISNFKGKFLESRNFIV